MAELITILGGGESGTGAALLAKHKGFDVFVSDAGPIAQNYRKILLENQIEFEEDGHTWERIIQSGELIKSPGIPFTAPIVKRAIEYSIPVIGEIEFAFRYCKGKIIAITGSNGKSTTTLWTYKVLKDADVDVAYGGNIGKSFAALLVERDYDWYVLEISSFQLDETKLFRPDIAVLLNITPDHLDRYEYKMENYTASKFKITSNQNSSDYFIYNYDDPNITAALTRFNPKAQHITFSLKDISETNAWVSGDQIFYHFNQNKFHMTISELALQGKHNTYNSMAAALSGQILNIKKDNIRESLMDFSGLEHRLEFVGNVHGIEFINDSKATNVNSTWYALESVNKPIVWIAGGVDKGNDYSEIADLVRKKVKAIVCLGADNRKLQEAFSRQVDIMVTTDSMADAVDMAYRIGANGDAVLLSPACASFDLFENYQQRGDQFKALVKSL